MVSHCRDIMDECDIMLSPRVQLIYPSGVQSVVDGHPNRWIAAQELLRMVKQSLAGLKQRFGDGIDVEDRGSGSFPIVHLLRKEVEEAMVTEIVSKVCQTTSPLLPMDRCSVNERKLVVKFLSQETFSKDEAKETFAIFNGMEAARKNLLLVRGYVVHRLMVTALNKRWNVQFGLHPQRPPVAVPFSAKGKPSPTSEFGHMDLSIVLTCLSFYFGGLSSSQMRECLQHLLAQDDPSLEYDRWVTEIQPSAGDFCCWQSINLDDNTQFFELCTRFRLCMSTINLYLNNFVFPKYARQFETKLASSSWDLLLSGCDGSSPILEENCRPGDTEIHKDIHTPQNAARIIPDSVEVPRNVRPMTTGFSGTNDSRMLLPLSIRQMDIEGLNHTNAEVLTYLLQKRNRKYICATDGEGKRLNEERLLGLIAEQKPPIRMIVDGGALIREMDNMQFVGLWLRLVDAPAAVFFDAADQIMVKYPSEDKHMTDRIEPLAASPYAEDLSECLVYLDEAHTRGTDLKMPYDARAALTLGPGQTKDHTVQAAMRLRQLGHMQSVLMIAPPEVNQSICDLTGKATNTIDSGDVVYWLLEQTCRAVETLEPLYTSQGLEYCRRSQSIIENPNCLQREQERRAYLKALEQPEKFSLEDMYAVNRQTTKHPLASSFATPRLRQYVQTLLKQHTGLTNSGADDQALVNEEQEREVELEVEIEAVRDVQKPGTAKPLQHTFHSDVERFCQTGRIESASAAYFNAFDSLLSLSVGSKLSIAKGSMASKLLVTGDFSKTVGLPKEIPLDDFQRSVQWIVYSRTNDIAMIISPFEAEKAVEVIEKAKQYGVHLLTYAAPVTRKMAHFDNLKFHSIPPLPPLWKAPQWISIDIGLFAGRLHFEFSDYDRLRAYLGIHPNDSLSVRLARPSPFTDDPRPFLHNWLAIRRKGQDFSHTPMGYLCAAKLLSPHHPFFLGDEGSCEDEDEQAATGAQE